MLNSYCLFAEQMWHVKHRIAHTNSISAHSSFSCICKQGIYTLVRSYFAYINDLLAPCVVWHSKQGRERKECQDNIQITFGIWHTIYAAYRACGIGQYSDQNFVQEFVFLVICFKAVGLLRMHESFL